MWLQNNEIINRILRASDMADVPGTTHYLSKNEQIRENQENAILLQTDSGAFNHDFCTSRLGHLFQRTGPECLPEIGL